MENIINAIDTKDQFIHQIIKKIWLEDIINDYTNSYLLKEDTLKNAFYFHLRRRLGDDYLLDNNLRIFTEYKIDTQRIDLVIAEINPDKASEEYLGDCVVRLIAVIEMKYKNGTVGERDFNADIKKIYDYISIFQSNTIFYPLFISERKLYLDEATYWLPDEYLETSKGRITELYSFIDKATEKMVWLVEEH